MKKVFLIKFIICFLLIIVNLAFAKDYGKKPYLATHLTYPEFMEAKTIFEVDKIEGYTFRRLEFKKPYQEGVADKMYPDYPTMTHYFDHPFIYDKTPVEGGRIVGNQATKEILIIPTEDWDNRTSNACWIANPSFPYGVWLGSAWYSQYNSDAGMHYVALSTTGSWALGYRPKKGKVTVSAFISLIIRDEINDDYYDNRDYSSELVFDIVYTGSHDIKDFWALSENAFIITKIEFE